MKLPSLVTATSLLSAQYGTTLNVDVTFANQTFKLLVDTGSSDTYVVRNDFICINQTTNLEIPQADCQHVSPGYNESDTYRLIPNKMFGIQYGNGIASGVMAYEDITLAGITVPGQAVGIVDHSNPMGDGINSGVLGLAYPSPHLRTSRRPYRQYNILGLVSEPYFSIALAHTPRNLSMPTFGGYLTLGDLPPVAYDPKFASVPVEILENIPPGFTSGKRTRSYWAFTVSAVTFGSTTKVDLTTSTTSITTNSMEFQVFTDTGNDYSYLPAVVADPINALFDPPAIYNETLGAAVVNCNAQPPMFGVQIGDQTFYHDGQDLIYQTGDGYCVSSLVASERVAFEGIMLNILGVSFLKNVVSVYDFGRNELRFAQRSD
ncbi:Peptidase aspartic catalytic [Penicillium expansum]|nr:Peptidase aspartic catalytic [Penicillium expansum]